MLHRILRTALAGLVVVSILLLGACQQGPGGTGARGPAGPQGPPGPTGPAGPALTSVILTVSSSDFVAVSNTLAAATYSVPAISGEIARNGLVTAYTDLGGAELVSPPERSPI